MALVANGPFSAIAIKFALCGLDQDPGARSCTHSSCSQGCKQSAVAVMRSLALPPKANGSRIAVAKVLVQRPGVRFILMAVE